jgi:hypothetical protein
MLTYKLGAYTQDFDLMRELFADSDFTTEPQVSSAEQKGCVLNDVGLCLMAQGRLTEALPLLERSIIAATASNNWEAAASGGASATRRGARIYRANYPTVTACSGSRSKH